MFKRNTFVTACHGHESVQVFITFCACLNVISLHHLTDALISFCPDVVTILPAMIHIRVPVFSFWANLSQLLPTVSADLLSLQDVISDRGTSIVFRDPPFKINAG